jgi:hypothetical protein
MPQKHRYKLKVMNGTVSSTPGGVKKSGIKTVKKYGATRYVYKKKSEQAKKNFSGWNNAVNQAKKNLGIPVKSFVILKRGTDLYEEAARIYY